VREKQALFARYGMVLTFEKEALRILAQEARALNLGARGLRRVVNQVLAAEEFDLPELACEGVVTEIVVTEATARRAARATQIRKYSRAKREPSEQPTLFDSGTGEGVAEVEQPRRRRGDLDDVGVSKRRQHSNAELQK
jgi:ATP-dependent Clp protease ATP-binding subunit ClpX